MQVFNSIRDRVSDIIVARKGYTVVEVMGDTGVASPVGTNVEFDDLFAALPDGFVELHVQKEVDRDIVVAVDPSRFAIASEVGKDIVRPKGTYGVALKRI